MSDLVRNARDYANGTGYMDGAGPEVRLWVHNLCDELERLTRELEEARKDAERYRWLAETLWTCELNQYSGPHSRQYLWSTRFSSPLHNENASLGGAIDAAMSQEKRKGALDRMARDADELGLDF